MKKDNIYFGSKMYPTILSNQGLCVDNLVIYGKNLLLCNALSQGSKSYQGSIYLKDGSAGQVQLLYFSPNVIRCKVATKGNNLLVLNQNYDPAWRVSGLSDNKVICTDGLLSANIMPRDKGIITFYYFSSSFYLGMLISIFALTGVICHRKSVISNKMFFAVLLFCLFVFWGNILFKTKVYSEQAMNFYLANKQVVRGIKYYRNDDFAQAIPYLRQAIAYFPNSFIVHKILQECYESEGQKEMALQEERHMQELAPHTIDALQ